MIKIPKEFEDQIDQMSLAEKCQHFVDHKTAKMLMKNGFIKKPQWNLHTKQRKPALHEALKCPMSWATFYMEHDLDVWDMYLPEPHYNLWVENRLIMGEIIQV